MKAVYRFFSYRKIRLGAALSLIFFVLFIVACKQIKEEIRIAWQNKQATGIIIPRHLLGNMDSAIPLLSVRLEKTASAMLGDYTVKDDEVVFQPLVPLTRGLGYEIFFRNRLIGEVTVPMADASDAPRLVSVYPSADSLPENLLKVYLEFSAPMQEGVAMQNLALVDEKGDTLPNVFLNQELWNKERTALTLWLDPGRIKRDLVPNQEMGNPLKKGHHYTLMISNAWKDVQGLPLQQSYSKQFYVGERDDTSPEPNLWEIKPPLSGSDHALQVQFNEALDYFLLLEAISVANEKGDRVTGTVRVSNNEKGIEFIPVQKWQAGRYRMRVAPHLEDLAGNNLVRPFDRDIAEHVKNKEEHFVEREFVVRN